MTAYEINSPEIHKDLSMSVVYVLGWRSNGHAWQNKTNLITTKLIHTQALEDRIIVEVYIMWHQEFLQTLQ